MVILSEKAQHSTAAVFGSSGGIGKALVDELIQRGVGRIYSLSRSSQIDTRKEVISLHFDLKEERTIMAAAKKMKDKPPDMTFVATGILTLSDGSRPERSVKELKQECAVEMFLINTIGPAIIAKNLIPLFDRKKPTVFAALTARVGSNSDNALGGWHSYRSSKAALNMLLKNLAIELGRTHPSALVVGLHPGTVDSNLSKPFQSGIPQKQLLHPKDAARSLLNVVSRLKVDDSGKVFDWRGDLILP